MYQTKRMLLLYQISVKRAKNPMLLSAISVSISEANIVFIPRTSGFWILFQQQMLESLMEYFFFQTFVARSLFNFELR